MAQKKRPPTAHPIEIDFDGRTWRGHYTVSGGMLHVDSGVGTRSTVLHGPPDDGLAEIILRELVEYWLHRERLAGKKETELYT